MVTPDVGLTSRAKFAPLRPTIPQLTRELDKALWSAVSEPSEAISADDSVWVVIERKCWDAA
jgi:hypothetical protein